MTKQLTTWIIAFTIPFGVFGQTKSFTDTAAAYFEEIQTAAKQRENLWGRDLYGPILLVRPDTREVFSNHPDTAGVLKKDGPVYRGILPGEVNISNTAVNWGGRRWSMVMLPLPKDKKRRINLLAHELFHRAQPDLGFFAYNPHNNHLDQKEGRIYLRLELEALKKAVLAASAAETKAHLTNALSFRKYRHSIYPGADSSENLLELNEGICEYTGVMLSGRTPQEMQTHFAGRIDRFEAGSSYVRSFAYETVPVYGYLLREINPFWNKEINRRTNLSEYCVSAFQIRLPEDLEEWVPKAAAQYDWNRIRAEETEREEKTRRLIGEYKRKFVLDPHLDIPFENMNMSFDFRVIMPLDTLGTVYPIIRVVDNWGVLTVENGALIDPNWQRITVSYPAEVSPGKASGEGWTLELNDGYHLEKDRGSGNYILTKK